MVKMGSSSRSRVSLFCHLKTWFCIDWSCRNNGSQRYPPHLQRVGDGGELLDGEGRELSLQPPHQVGQAPVQVEVVR
jgi:hypothetical protein